MIEYKITQTTLKKFLHYNPETGNFTWTSNRQGFVTKGQIAGTPDKDGYIYITVIGKRYQAHRLAFLWMLGYWPENDIDHINRNPSYNKWDNLREASKKCNARNRKICCTNTSGIAGIDKHHGLWRVRIRANDKRISLGHFHVFIDAVKARWKAEVEHGYSNCNSTSPAYLHLKEIGAL